MKTPQIYTKAVLFYQLLGTLAAIGAGIPRPLMTVLFGNLVNTFNGAGAASRIQSAVDSQVLYFVYLFIGQWILVCAYGILFSISAMHYSVALRNAYMRTAICKRQGDSNKGNAASDLSATISSIEDAFSEKLGIVVQAMSCVVSSLIIGFTRSWRLTLVLMVSIVVLLASNFSLAALDSRIQRRMHKVDSKAAAHAQDSLHGVRAIVTTNAQHKIMKIYSSMLDQSKLLGFRKAPLLASQYSISFFVLLAAYGLAFWYGTKLLDAGEIENGGTIVIVILCINQGANAMREIVPIWGVFAKARADLNALLESIRTPPSIDPMATDGKSFVARDIELQNLSFAYPSRPDVLVLDDISIKFSTNQTTALVGPSGCGKSTIVALLERWFDPVSGSIRIGQFAIAEYNIRSLRSSIGLVQQDSLLFNDTIFSNVSNGLYGSPLETLDYEAKLALVKQACKEADAHDFIEQLSDGYQTCVGEGGSLLSGGQRQRIAIARALVASPSILIFDEATSALDGHSESLIEATIERVSRSRTTILISHKLSLVRRAHHIYMFSRGQVLESGNHATLLDRNGQYARICQEQDMKEAVGLQKREGALEEPQILPDVQEKHQDQISATEDKQDVLLRHPTFTLLRQTIGKNTALAYLFPASLILCILGGGIFPVQAIVFGNAVSVFGLPADELTQQADFWALMFLVLGVIAVVVYSAFGIVSSTQGTLSTRRIRERYFDAMMRQPIVFYDSNMSSTLTAQISTHTAQMTGLLSVVGSLGVAVVNVVSSAILSLVIAWKLALVALFGSMPLIVFAGYLRVRTASRASKSLTEPLIASAQYAAEAIGMLRTVSSLTMEHAVCDELDHRMRAAQAPFYRNIFTTMPLFAFSKSGPLLGMALNFWYGSQLLSRGEISATQLWIVFMAIVAGAQAAGEFFASSNNIARAKSAATAIMKVVSTAEVTEETQDTRKETGMISTISLNDLSFRYPSANMDVLKQVTAQFTRGKHSTIVGPSGSGKSTIISLLARFYEPPSGAILVDGQAASNIPASSYRSALGLISQETVLFQGTILSNILLGVSGDDSSPENLKRAETAARQAHIHEFILSLPEGYGTQCGANGIDLSGGQRQRLAIARALAKDPQVLLCDEPTSSLDADSERAVMQTLKATKGDRIMITVTHRLGTIRDADNIFVLADGRIREQGTHEELLKLNGMYWGMWKSQQLDRQLD